MKYLFLIFILSYAIPPTVNAQPILLASVEMIEADANTNPPIEKKKFKKKKGRKKHFKKPNHSKQEPTKKRTKIFTTIALISFALAGIFFLLFILFLIQPFFTSIVGVFLGISAIFLVVTLVFTILAIAAGVQYRKYQREENL